MRGSHHNLDPLLLCLYFREARFQTTIKACVLLPRLQNYTTPHKITLGVYLSKIWSYFILTFVGPGRWLLGLFFFVCLFVALQREAITQLSVVIYCGSRLCVIIGISWHPRILLRGSITAPGVSDEDADFYETNMSLEGDFINIIFYTRRQLFGTLKALFFESKCFQMFWAQTLSRKPPPKLSRPVWWGLISGLNECCLFSNRIALIRKPSFAL